jgi:hypothetical protein
MSDEYIATLPSAFTFSTLADLKDGLLHLDEVEIVREDANCIAFRLRSNSRCENWPEDARLSLLESALLLSIDSGKERQGIVSLVTALALAKGTKIKFEEQ